MALSVGAFLAGVAVTADDSPAFTATPTEIAPADLAGQPATRPVGRVVIPPVGHSADARLRGQPRGDEAEAWGLVRRLLDRRAAAWRAGHPPELASVFAPGSTVLARDQAALRHYLARGFSVRGMKTQIADVRLRQHDGHEAQLLVVDRLARIAVRRAGVRRELPRDRATRHLLTLVRRAGHWRIGSVQLA